MNNAAAEKKLTAITPKDCCMFQFPCRFAFLLTFRLSNRTLKITRILTLYQANAPNLTRCNFINIIPKLTVFGTHNLQTFKLNTFVNKLLLIQLFLFNIRDKLHHWSDENYASRCLSTEETCMRYFSVCSL